ncbi:class E sortase [Streptomyces luteolus]|uniref:Class E sortase n=1 Tax=Streptomyces luteolus TaxID=3043615 RepID=A0ABT6T032_9ACTN|nr:class E sortase [Streptomyces sp. B-S-A12]MDI3421006.1 class E sortase [Streptomyces sp. B-S-A12]
MRVLLRTFSELCLTIGMLIVLFVAYVLFWTSVKADGAMDSQIDQLRSEWSSGSVSAGEDASVPAGEDAGAGESDETGGGENDEAGAGESDEAGAGENDETGSAPPAPPAYQDGKAFAVMYIPRFGFTWNKPVLEGTKVDTLKKGLGHYASTAQLGQRGNFSVAGHRRTYGDPFKDFPKLRPGDPVVLTDGSTWFTYRIVNKPYKTLPSDIGVIDPVPRKSGLDGPGRYLTLTTCEPEWGHSHRLIVWAHLDATQPVEKGKPEALRS